MRSLLPLFLLVSLREFRSRPLRSLIAVAGIALGVSLMVAVGTVNHSAIIAMEDSTGEFLGRATLELSGGSAGVREELAR